MARRYVRRSRASDGGLLLLRHADRKLGICRRLADAMPDRRDARRIRHEMFEMVMARVAVPPALLALADEVIE
jgi:hypothetical protein